MCIVKADISTEARKRKGMPYLWRFRYRTQAFSWVMQDNQIDREERDKKLRGDFQFSFRNAWICLQTSKYWIAFFSKPTMMDIFASYKVWWMWIVRDTSKLMMQTNLKSVKKKRQLEIFEAIFSLKAKHYSADRRQSAGSSGAKMKYLVTLWASKSGWHCTQ